MLYWCSNSNRPWSLTYVPTSTADRLSAIRMEWKKERKKRRDKRWRITTSKRARSFYDGYASCAAKSRCRDCTRHCCRALFSRRHAFRLFGPVCTYPEKYLSGYRISELRPFTHVRIIFPPRLHVNTNIRANTLSWVCVLRYHGSYHSRKGLIKNVMESRNPCTWEVPCMCSWCKRRKEG